MPRITPGNRLYIYQLLSREIGTGRQTLISRVEEVFAADDLLPEDMGCTSVQEVLEQLDGVVKLTVFKKGNTYATVLQNDAWDQALQQSDEPSQAKKAAAKGKPWKHRSKAKVVRPAKPRHQKPREAQGAEGAEATDTSGVPEPAEPPATQPVDTPVAQPTAVAEPAEPEPTQPAPAEPHREEHTQEPAPASATPPLEEEGPATTPVEPASPAESSSTAEAAPEPEPNPAPQPAHEPPIRFTVTYDPTAEEGETAPQAEPELELQPESQPEPQVEPETQPHPQPTPAAAEPEAREQSAAEAEPVVEVKLVSPAEEQAVAIEPLLVGLPSDFAAQVHVPNGPLSLLYQLVSPDTNPLDLLAEDWQVARSTRSYEGTRSLVTFPLRLAHDDATPVRATIRRSARGVAGKHWVLAAIDGNDGTGEQPDDPGPDGLPETGSLVERLLAGNIELGPWHETFSALAAVATPEPWDLPEKPGGLDVLRIYLAATYRAVLDQGLLAVSGDERRAAFATGLLSPLSQPVYACLERPEGAGETSPWRLLGFSTTGEGTLGEYLASLGSLPQAPRYLRSLADLELTGTVPHVPRSILRRLGDNAQEMVEAAVSRCVADYRLLAPAVDLETGHTCLLIPLATKEATKPDLALSMGTADTTRLLGLSEAYVEARIVSRGMPGWLRPDA